MIEGKFRDLKLHLFLNVLYYFGCFMIYIQLQ